MGRPRKVVTESQGDEVTKETVVKVKKVQPPKEKELKVNDTYLVEVDGSEQYMTRSVITVALTRGIPDIKVPKGSPFIMPKNAKCSTK